MAEWGSWWEPRHKPWESSVAVAESLYRGEEKTQTMRGVWLRQNHCTEGKKRHKPRERGGAETESLYRGVEKTQTTGEGWG